MFTHSRQRKTGLVLAVAIVTGTAYLVIPDSAEDAPQTTASVLSGRSVPSTPRVRSLQGTGSGEPTPAQAIVAPTSPDELTPEQIQQTVQGIWQSEYYGTRYLQIRDDGKATIFFEANMMASMFVGQRLKLEYEWSYDPQSRQVQFTVLSGTPQKSLDYVLKMWGKNMRQNVLAVSQSELQLQDLDGKTTHIWKQLPEIPPAIQSRFEKL